MKLLLTGGTGFFGRSLLRYYLSSRMLPIEVFVLSRNPCRFLNAYPEFQSTDSIAFLKGDIQCRRSLPWSHSFTHIIHAATDSTSGGSLTPLARYDQIVEGTRNILDLAVAAGARRFLLTSSGAVYGSQPVDLASITEDWPGSPPLSDPGSAYGQGKRAAEHLCALYRDLHSIETVIARCFAFVGRDLPLDAHYAIGNFIQDALGADQITVAGDGSPLRTYLDQSDLAHWLWTLVFDGLDGEIYNIGSDRVIDIASLAYLVRDILAPRKPVRILGNVGQNSSRCLYIPSIQKIKALHGLRPQLTLEQAILNAAGSHRFT